MVTLNSPGGVSPQWFSPFTNKSPLSNLFSVAFSYLGICLCYHAIAYKVFLISYYSFLKKSYYSFFFNLSFSLTIPPLHIFSFFLFFYLSLSLFFFFFWSKKLFFSSSILGSHMSSPTISLRVHLVGGVEKWEDKKWGKDRKVGE